METSETKKPRAKPKRHPPEVWARVKADYLGGLTGPAAAARHGVNVGALRRRAYLERWTKAALPDEPPAPLCAGGEAEMMLRMAAETLVRSVLGAVEAAAPPPVKYATNVVHGPRVWANARADYEAGATMRRVCDHYGIKIGTFSQRASREGWRKADMRLEPPPRLIGEDGDGLAGAAAPVSEWPKIAHEAQKPPAGAWATWLFQGGRGAGKTRAGAEWLAARAEASPGGRFALVGATLGDVREVMVEGESGLINLPGRERVRFEASRRRVVWPKSGAVAHCFSAEEPERLRGPQFEAAWADEFCAWKRPGEVLALLRMGLRLGGDPRLVVTTTPKPIAALRALKGEGSCVETRAATGVNAGNLAPTFLETVTGLYGGTRLAAQELDGLMVEAAEGALWRAADLAGCRGGVPERFDRVVVAVDPPAGTGSGEGGPSTGLRTGSACGIVVAGRRGERCHVLADRSVAGASPLGWARAVAEAAFEWGAGCVVAEANQGGDMVRSVLAGAGVGCRIRLVHASRGKRARAEPVAALYEQGRVVHCAAMPALEEEMLALGSGEGSGECGGRLDRADALVWAVSALMLEDRPAPRVRFL